MIRDFCFLSDRPKWFFWIQFFPRADHRIDGKERAPLYQSNHYTITPFHHRLITALKLKKTNIRKALSRGDKCKFLLTQLPPLPAPPSPSFHPSSAISSIESRFPQWPTSPTTTKYSCRYHYWGENNIFNDRSSLIMMLKHLHVKVISNYCRLPFLKIANPNTLWFAIFPFLHSCPPTLDSRGLSDLLNFQKGESQSPAAADMEDLGVGWKV